MSTVPAPDRLAALERDVLIAVAAFVVDGARGGVDLRRVLRGVVRVVGVGGHIGAREMVVRVRLGER